MVKEFSETNLFLDELPIRVVASFLPVIDYWREMAKSEEKPIAQAAKAILDSIASAPELFEPFDDISLIDKYKDEINTLFRPLFPDMLQGNEIKGLTLPFKKFFFNPTQRLQDIIDRAGEDYSIVVRGANADNMYIMSAVGILNGVYGVNLAHKMPFFLTIPDREAGIDRYYRAFINGDFVNVKPNENTIPLTEDDINLLIDNYTDIDLWKEKMPPNSYDFEGFSMMTLFDVTVDESLSAMKNILLKQDALHKSESLEALETYLRSYFQMSDLSLGVASIDLESGKVRALKDHWTCEMDKGDIEYIHNCYCDQSLGEVVRKKSSFVVSNLDNVPVGQSPLIDRMVSKGIKSFVVCPLEYHGDVVGVIELSSRTPYALNSVVASKMRDIIPLYTIAMQRSVTERSTKIDAIIQEEFTSMHPSVSWKFHEVAEDVLANRESGDLDNIKDVVFRDVTPLYGQFDIRGSSSARNKAVEHDLIKQLNHAEGVMDIAQRESRLPIYDHHKFLIQNWRSRLESGISAGDEIKILEFLKQEIYPVFSHLKDGSAGMRQAVEDYMSMLDPSLGVIYGERKSYEDSVTKINDAINEVIENHQDKAQSMYPHYFEKYKTDGIEYNIYLGQSITPQQVCDPIYIKNLRLWQLIMSHAVEMRIQELKGSLELPLDIVTLILVHSNPLSIRFRLDEMKFDVDGAYNIRYEIVKKRIDKAHIKGTSERLTQPGKLAIVYSHDDEMSEYMTYLDYMRSLNMVKGQIEQVELEDLQGTAGLKALRVDYNFDLDTLDTSVLEAVMSEDA